MDTFHARCASVALSVLARYGFALAGGYAIQLHALVVRPSNDIDLFTNEPDEGKFRRAANEAVEAWITDGISVETAKLSGTFARYILSDEYASMKAELLYDPREEPPVFIEIGPVLSRNDSVANKVLALYGRNEARDGIDVYSAAAEGGFSRAELENLATTRDSGFHLPYFANTLRACAAKSDSAFAQYGLSGSKLASLRTYLLSWADEIDGRS